jgi:hypothetical protein
MIVKTPLTVSVLRSTRRWLLVTTLSLSVSAGSGCARHVPFTRAAVAQVATSDNAILATIPAGTIFQFPHERDTAAFRRLFVSELRQSAPNVETTTPLKIATGAYLEERNRVEELLIRDNLALQEEVKALRRGAR